jgi:hypothetical protein
MERKKLGLFGLLPLFFTYFRCGLFFYFWSAPGGRSGVGSGGPARPGSDSGGPGSQKIHFRRAAGQPRTREQFGKPSNDTTYGI